MNGTREKYRKRKHMIEREKRRGAHNKRLRTELVDTAPPLLFLASKTLPFRLVMPGQGGPGDRSPLDVTVKERDREKRLMLNYMFSV